MDGSFRVGDSVAIKPSNLNARIRGLQTHKQKRDIAHPGTRVAINLTGIDRDEIYRGQTVTKPGMLRESKILDIQYRHLPDAETSLKHNTAVKVYIGSAEVNAHARIIGQEEVKAGEAGPIQLALESPTVAVRGDRLILRRPSPGATLGGGQILDPNPGRRHRRFKADVLARFATLEKGSPDELLFQTLSRLGPTDVDSLLQKAGLQDEAGHAALQHLLDSGQVVVLDKFVLTASTRQYLQDQALDALTHYHRDNPLKAGIERESLRSKLQLLSAPFTALIQSLTNDGLIVELGALLRLPDHFIRFSPEQERAIADLMDIFSRQGVNSPSVKECRDFVGDALYFALVDSGKLKPLNSEVVYSVGTYTELITRLEQYLLDKGSVTAAEVRDLLGTSRKYAIALLEHLDELRITRRVGDRREFHPGRF
jgi:selenocysteine-specific elongation factor